MQEHHVYLSKSEHEILIRESEQLQIIRRLLTSKEYIETNMLRLLLGLDIWEGR